MTVEAIESLLRTAVAERQALRDRGADGSLLERNRLRIVELQWELSRALIARFLPKLAAA